MHARSLYRVIKIVCNKINRNHIENIIYIFYYFSDTNFWSPVYNGLRIKTILVYDENTLSTVFFFLKPQLKYIMDMNQK